MGDISLIASMISCRVYLKCEKYLKNQEKMLFTRVSHHVAHRSTKVKFLLYNQVRTKSVQNWKRPSMDEYLGPKEPWERARARQDIKSNFYFGSGLGFFGFTLIFGYSTEMLGTGNYPADHKAMKIVNKAQKPAQTVIEEEEDEEDDDSSDSESVAEFEPPVEDEVDTEAEEIAKLEAEEKAKAEAEETARLEAEAEAEAKAKAEAEEKARLEAEAEAKAEAEEKARLEAEAEAKAKAEAEEKANLEAEAKAKEEAEAQAKAIAEAEAKAKLEAEEQVEAEIEETVESPKSTIEVILNETNNIVQDIPEKNCGEN